KKRYMVLAIIVGFCIVVFTLLPKPYGESVNLGRLFSIQSRLSDYNEGIRIWKASPLIGIGYNRIRYVKEKTPEAFEANHAGASFHSSFLIILVTGGVIGLVLFLGMLYKIWGIDEFTKVAVVFISIISLTDNVLLHPFILYMFFWTCLVFHFNYRSGTSR
ncbi:MAG: O-antigen ligase family protein, partial [bacterium]|nr:O-antigen ligase family protein [bacterium]